MNDPSTRLLTLCELALELRIGGKRRSLLWLRDLAEAGRIPSLRPDGGNLRFNLRAVEAALIELAAIGQNAAGPAMIGVAGCGLTAAAAGPTGKGARVAGNCTPTIQTIDAAPAAAAVLRPLAAILVQVADRRRERAQRQLDGILTQLAAGGGKVGRWAERLQQDGQSGGGDGTARRVAGRE